MGGGGHRLLRRCPRPVPGRQRPGRDRGQPARPGGPTPPGQVRSSRCPGRRPSGPGGSGHGPAQGWRRPGGDDPVSAGRSGDQRAGPHPGHQCPQGAAGDRPSRAPRPLRVLSAARLVAAAAALEPGPITSPQAATRLAMGILARRYQALSTEISTSPPSWSDSRPWPRRGWWPCSAWAPTAPACC
jgi:hypothetical protein